MAHVYLSENHNGRFLVLQQDQWISYGILHDDLRGVQLTKFDQLLAIGKSRRPYLRHVIDGGANHGSWTIPLAMAHSDLDFHAFEVQRFIYHACCGSVSLNGLTNVFMHWAGLAESNGSVTIPVPDYSVRGNFGAFEARTPWANSDHAASNINHSGRTDTVRLTAIDDLRLCPLMIKLDVEGMEWAALQGAANTIANWSPMVWCESHKSNPGMVIPFFVDQGYSVFTVDEHWMFMPRWAAADQDMLNAIHD